MNINECWMSAFPLLITTYNTQRYATMVVCQLLETVHWETINIRVYTCTILMACEHIRSMCYSVGQWKIVCTLTNDATTSHRGVHRMISLLMFITVWDRRRANSLILNINTARAVWGIALEYSAFALCLSVWRGQTLREQKGTLVQQRAFNWVMHCTISSKGGLKTVDTTREKLIQLLAFPAQWKWQPFFSLSNKQ